MTEVVGPHPPPQAVAEAVARALAEDLGILGDLTAALVPEAATARLGLVARAPGVVAGQRCAEAAFAMAAPAAALTWGLPDGTAVGPGERIAEISGPLRQILMAERTALNFLCHLSGVASLTRRFVDAVGAVNAEVRIIDTRKTTPGLRALEKAAVRAGGGHNHRATLSDAVLLKDNHLGGLGIAEAVALARRSWPGRAVEVECERPDQVAEALAAGATMIMLDNMGPEMAQECVELVRSQGAAQRVLVEASGGVSLETAPALAAAGVDLISVGALTHSAPILDLGLDLEGQAAEGSGGA